MEAGFLNGGLEMVIDDVIEFRISKLHGHKHVTAHNMPMLDFFVTFPTGYSQERSIPVA